jgi:sugar phosphate isomerase/epimerase
MSDSERREELSRRSFLANLAGLGMGGAWLAGCAGGGTAAPTPAGQAATVLPLSQRIGVQLYTVRDRMGSDFESTLEQVAAIGYDDVEFAGYYDRTPQQVRALLDRLNLRAPSSHIALEQFRSDLDGVLASAKQIGHEWVTVPFLPPAERGDLEKWRSLAAEFNRYAAAAKQQGLNFAYHNHDFEFAGVRGGQTGYDVLLEDTDPDLVDFELDIYWATFAGRDAVEIFNRAPGRFKLWHVKDLAGTGAERGMAPVGKGQIDWKRIFDNAELAGLRYPFVEHDSAASYPGGSVESIRTSFQYLEQLLA